MKDLLFYKKSSTLNAQTEEIHRGVNPWLSSFQNKVVLSLLIIIVSFMIFSFRILDVPPGLESDENSIAYNAVLISKTLHDENGALLPFFILTNINQDLDWKQPFLIYLSAIFFKIFGPSLLIFKLVNITVAVVSLGLLMVILNVLFKEKKYLLFGGIIYITSPMVIVTSRIGNESLDPMLFSTMWLLSLILFRKSNKQIFLVLAAISLGIGFYSFKGMRLITPIMIVLTILFVYCKNLTTLYEYQNFVRKQSNLTVTIRKLFNILIKTLFQRKIVLSIIIFLVFLLPFFLIIPFLENRYPGSVFDNKQTFTIEPFRHYLYYWLSNLSLPSLFFKGDIGVIYTLDMYGIFLFANIPFFLLGCKRALEKFNFYTFILICFSLTPLLFGLAQSQDYGHRLTWFIPFFVIITTLGFKSFYEYANTRVKEPGISKYLLQFISLIFISVYI